ncbi:biotin synthase BioB [Endothiovibrio diazotrophicus]
MTEPRHDWSVDEIEVLYDLPFNDLLFRAQQLHRERFDANAVQISSLISIKTGACPEDCAYCPQSARHERSVTPERLMPVDEVIAAARRARERGAARFCMGASGSAPKARELEAIEAMIRGVKALGLETCATLGALNADQARRLREAGLDYYNHNLDTSPEYYGEIITTRSFDERLETLAHVREEGLKVCSGGIIGMGEGRRDRSSMLAALASLPAHPESVPINHLIALPGTPLEGVEPPDPFDFVRTIAVARIVLPAAHVRLSAGREGMSDELQALCFLAGANSIFYGEKLLTAGNAAPERDRALFARLGLRAEHENRPEPAAPPAGDAALWGRTCSHAH